MVLFGQKWLYLGKVVVFRQRCCTWAMVVVFEQMGSIRAKWFCSGNVVVIGQNMLYSDNMVVFGQK